MFTLSTTVTKTRWNSAGGGRSGQAIQSSLSTTWTTNVDLLLTQSRQYVSEATDYSRRTVQCKRWYDGFELICGSVKASPREAERNDHRSCWLETSETRASVIILNTMNCTIGSKCSVSRIYSIILRIIWLVVYDLSSTGEGEFVIAL